MLVEPTRGEGVKHVYLIVAPKYNTVKIGKAIDPLARLRDLQVANWASLYLAGTIPGYSNVEHIIHREFRHLNIRGEWYKEANHIIEVLFDIQPGSILHSKPYGYPIPLEYKGLPNGYIDRGITQWQQEGHTRDG